jgi:ribonuclease E
LQNKRAENLTAKCAREVASYVLNEKRDNLLAIEQAYGISIFIVGNDDMKGSQAVIERAGERAVVRRTAAAPVKIDSAFEEEIEEEAEDTEVGVADDAEGAALIDETEQRSEQSADGQAGRRRRRGRRGSRRGGRDNENERLQQQSESSEPMHEDDATETMGADLPDQEPQASQTEDVQGEERPQREGRGRRRGRGGRNKARGNGHDEQREPAMREAHEATEPVPIAAVPVLEMKQAPSPSITTEASQPAAPARKWQPPQPTVTRSDEQPARKTGWWSKRA